MFSICRYSNFAFYYSSQRLAAVLQETAGRLRSVYTIMVVRCLHFLGLLSGAPILRSKYPQPRYAFLRQCQASTGYNRVDRLHELHMPTLVMHGKKDKSAPYPLAEEMHAGIRGSRMITFQGGHIFFLFSERQRFLDAIAEFMER